MTLEVPSASSRNPPRSSSTPPPGLAAISTSAGEPAKGLVEIAGPETFGLDGAVRRALAARSDPRTVVADPAATYYGIAVGERSLVPANAASIGETRLDDWLREAVPVGAA